MPRLPSHRLPKLSRHKPTGQGRVRLAGRDHYLGVWPADADDPPEAVTAAYHRLVAEWVQSGRPATGGHPVRSDESDTEHLSVDELILRYLDHCDAYYRDADGRPTKEPEDVRLSLRPLSLLYGPTDAREFGARPFKLVREQMVRAGLSRRVVNQRAGRVKRLFRWAAAEELVPAAVHQAVQAVESLKPGRTAARDHDPVRPVDAAHVAAALPHMTRQVAAMVRVQLLCGCRPGEVVQMRGADLDTAGDVWTFRPHAHKGRWRGRLRVIYLGPQCQQVLTPFVRPDDPGRFLFSPAEAMAELRQRQKAGRKTRLTPAQVWVPKSAPLRKPGEQYTTRSYAKAVAAACARAGVPPWCPLQLRHTAATEARRLAGLDAAQALLGHARADVTQVYAERDDRLARKVARENG